MPEPTATARVALTISTFRSDLPVIALLELAFAPGGFQFHAVIVVDSLGSGAIQKAIEERGWPVRYVNSASNLGSAGNLALRIAEAAQAGADWCYCLNHDGHLDIESLQNMVACGTAAPKIGAVYPLLHHGSRSRPWESARLSFFPATGVRSDTRPTQDREVLWSSSNGALYNLAAYRAGLRVWSELWMCYEDLAYGMILHAAGWKQIVCAGAVLADIFDYKSVHRFGRTFVIPDKPAWYSYYNLRNLILIQRRLPFSLGMGFRTVAKALKESAKIVLLEDRRGERLALLFEGAVHGMRGQSGKGRYP